MWRSSIQTGELVYSMFLWAGRRTAFAQAVTVNASGAAIVSGTTVLASKSPYLTEVNTGRNGIVFFDGGGWRQRAPRWTRRETSIMAGTTNSLHLSDDTGHLAARRFRCSSHASRRAWRSFRDKTST